MQTLKLRKRQEKHLHIVKSSEKLKRVLGSNTRLGNNLKLLYGDSAYYKINNSKRWKDPGKVLGQDEIQIHFKHGSYYNISTLPCNISRKQTC